MTAIVLRMAHMLVALLFAATLVSGQAAAQQNLQDLLQDQQIVIDPNKLKVVPKPNIQVPLQPVLCQAPFVPKNGQCVCPDGKVKIGNSCQTLQILCQAPFVPKNGQCVCPDGKVKIGNSCQTLQILCQAPFVPKNGQCVCPDGKIKVGNSCVTPQVTCNAPFVPGSNGQCICPAGTQKSGNTCLSVQQPQPQPQPAQCTYPFVFNKPTNSCVCASGFRLSSRGDRCIRQKKQQKPPTLPRQTVIDIQRCLNLLGYDAGPVDGAAGRRTRSAWSSFRVDENLRGRPNRLGDEVTQDRLFQACRKAENNAQAPVAPAPAPQPSPPAVDEATAGGPIAPPVTNFDPATGYPDLQCASGSIRDLLEDMIGEDAKIELCGEACVPIPSGMTAEQIAATGSNVNWCLNCARIGEDDLICTAPEQSLDSQQ